MSNETQGHTDGSAEEPAIIGGDGADGDDAQGFTMPIRKYTGYTWDTHFGGFERGQNGRTVYIGVFPMERQPVQPGYYPPLR